MSKRTLQVFEAIEERTEYRHSPEARQMALRIKRDFPTRSALGAEPKDMLQDFALELTTDGRMPMGYRPGQPHPTSMNKSDLVDYLREAAEVVIQETKEDRSAASKTPQSRLELFFAQLRDDLEEVTKRQQKTLAAMAERRLSQVDGWVIAELTQAAAEAWACEYFLRYQPATERADEPMTLEEVKAEVTMDVLRNLRGLSKSTGQAHNLVEETRWEAVARRLPRY